MTQTQDEQNVQAAGTQGTAPVTDDQAVQATTPDLSAVDLTSETPVAAAPVQPVAEPVQPAETPVQGQSILQQ
ncbi:hypothetical protein J6T66_01950 [bacterium]|nr:hypothetical protein [bacterium]